MKRLAALLAVPDSTSLVNRVVTDNALLLPLSERLYQKDALLGKILELAQKVLVVVLDFDFVFGVSVATSPTISDLLVCLDLNLVIFKELSRTSQVLVCSLALFRVVFSAALI